MLRTDEEILHRFFKHLSWATELDLATAWATCNEGLRALQRRASSLKIRAVVGLWHSVTEPLALRKLADVGQLRAADSSRRFHPKVFVFRGVGRSVAWIGSANFTSGGFGKNEEALFETSDTESVQNWFDDLWGHCDPLDEFAIDEYENWRQSNPPSPTPPPSPASSPRPTPDTADLTPIEFLKGVRDWRSYVAALEHCDRWWRNCRTWSVLDNQRSWRATVEVLGDIVSQQDWAQLNQSDRLRLLGLTDRDGWDLLGRMRPPALNTVFGPNRERIQKTVLEVVTADDDAFPQLAFDAYEDLVMNVDGVREGIATRLLTLARPDRFVSLNTASRRNLATIYGGSRTTLWKPQNYRRLLTTIYNQEWCREPTPRNARERAVSRMRTALLDCFVYKDQHST